MQRLTYREEARAPGWRAAGACVLALGPLWSALRLVDDPTSPRILEAALLLVCAVALVFVAVVFSRLQVEVAQRSLCFDFGPFGRTLVASDLCTANVEPYRAWSFGGSCLRLGFASGRLTWEYIVPFMRTGVAVTTSGRRYYFLSQTPARLARAIELLAREGHA